MYIYEEVQVQVNEVLSYQELTDTRIKFYTKMFSKTELMPVQFLNLVIHTYLEIPRKRTQIAFTVLQYRIIIMTFFPSDMCSCYVLTRRLRFMFTPNVRFKLWISQFRKHADKNCPGQFLCVKLAWNYLFFSWSNRERGEKREKLREKLDHVVQIHICHLV